MSDAKELTTYQFSLEGWDGGTDATDHLVKWVNAPSISAYLRFVDRHALKLDAASRGYTDVIGPYGIEDGVDCIVDEDGNIIEGEIGAIE